jgi:hypothetical protein
MNGWLIDTNVVSALRTASPRDDLAAWFSGPSVANIFFSAVCLMELRYGAELAGGEKGRSLSRWIEDFVQRWFADTTLPVGDLTLLTWRRLLQRLRQSGKTIGEPDSLIAATALEHGLCVLTRDVRAFVACEVPVLNPWTREVHLPGQTSVKLQKASLAEALRALRRTR